MSESAYPQPEVKATDVRAFSGRGGDISLGVGGGGSLPAMRAKRQAFGKLGRKRKGKR